MQRVRVPDSDRVSYTVIHSNGLPVEAADVYLGHLTATGRSPYTVEAYAHDLRDFFEWASRRDADFRRLGLEDLAEFFAWLPRSRPTRQPSVYRLPGTPPAVGNTTLVRKRAALAGFYRFHARRDETVPALLGGPRPMGRYVPMLAHTRRHGPGPDAYSPILRLRAGEVRVVPRAASSRPNTDHTSSTAAS